MNFSEKIDIILKHNKLGLNTIEEIESHCAIGAKTLRKNYNDKTEPTRRILVKLLDGMGISQEWWDEQKGEIFKGNGTAAIKSTGNKENSLSSARETFYTDLIERNDEYSLLPRAVLKDYKIVPDKIIDVIIQSNENEKKALQDAKNMEIEGLNKKYELLIEGYENKIKRLETENESLKRQIPAQQQ